MSESRYPTRVSDPDETTRIPKEALEGLRDADKARDAGFPVNGSSGGGATAAPAVPRSAEPATPPANGSPARPGSNGFGSDSAPASPRPPVFGDGTNGSNGANGANGASGFRGEPTGAGSGAVPAAGGGLGSPGSGPGGQGSGGHGSGGQGSGGHGSGGLGSGGLGSGGPGSGGLGSPGAGSSAGSSGSSGGAGPTVGSPGLGGPGSTPPVPSPIGYPERSQTGYSPAAYQGSYSSGYPSVADAPTTVSGPGAGLAGGAAAGAGLGAGATAAARSSLGTATRPPAPARGATGAGAGRPPRRARLLVRHIDPWSTLKFSFVLSVAMFFVWLVAVGVLYGVLDGMGVFEEINGLYGEVSGNGGDRLFSPGLVLGSATVVGAINIVLFTALATIGAFVYNICSDLVGGIEVTLAERD